MKKFVFLILLLGITGLATAADDDDDSDSGGYGGPCSHPNFVTHSCLDSYGYGNGEDGSDGIDGTNGTNGTNGSNGSDGANGADGTNGIDGLDGVAGIDGTDGADGLDGLNGLDGADGQDGVDGRDGKNGLDGRNGRDGVVPNSWYKAMESYIAATAATQIYLPSNGGSRLTFGSATVNGRGALGVGYAFVNDDGVAFTLGYGRALRGSPVISASFGFEF